MLPPVYFLLAIGVMIGLHYLAPIARWMPGAWRWTGWVPIALGVTLGLWGDLLFRRHGTTIKPYEPSSALVTGGPFGLTRNPMYLAMALLLAGIAALAGTLAPVLVIPVFVALIDYRFVRMEEGMLQDRFGDEYEAYKRRVRRWI